MFLFHASKPSYNASEFAIGLLKAEATCYLSPMKFRLLLFVVLGLLCWRCKPTVHPNRFGADPDLLVIAQHQDARNTAALLPFLHAPQGVLRAAAARAFGSVQDSSAFEPLSELLSDQDASVREAAAFALGQLGTKRAEKPLLHAFENETEDACKIALLEAVGKSGSEVGLFFAADLKPGNDKTTAIAQALAIYRFALQGQVLESATQQALKLMGNKYPQQARFYATQYLARTRKLDLSTSDSLLIQTYQQEKDVFCQLGLVAALGKSETEGSTRALLDVLTSDVDYRLHVWALRSLNGRDGPGVREQVWQSLANPTPQVAEQAGLWLLSNGQRSDSPFYWENAVHVPFWKARALVLAAAIRHQPKDADYGSAAVSLYQAANSTYEKGALLQALAESPGNFSFLMQQPFSTEMPLSTFALEALVACKKSPAYAAEADSVPHIAQDSAFWKTMEKAIQSGDVALMGLAAGAFRDPVLNYRMPFSGADFLHEAAEKLALPREVETCHELRKTIAYLEGSAGLSCEVSPDQHPVDWEHVVRIPADLKVHIQTEKGEIVLRLLVEEAPGSVSNFLQLIEQGFYSDFVFHRVVPAFVIQDGCPRGDGWGSPENAFVRSEFYPRSYGEGLVGMASAGKDTESSQWFITHNPTPHLDGRYTIFAEVESGMEVVHQIAVGDQIVSYSVGSY